MNVFAFSFSRQFNSGKRYKIEFCVEIRFIRFDEIKIFSFREIKDMILNGADVNRADEIGIKKIVE